MSDARRIMRALILVGVLASAAHADTKSWSALKSHVPPGAVGVLSGDLAAAKAQPVFAKAFNAFVTAQKELGQVLDMAKAKCGLDPLNQITDGTVIVGAHDHGVVAIGVNGIDEAQLGKCLDALAAADKGNALASKKVGALTKYWEKGKPEDHDPLYVTWLAKDVIAVGIDAGHPDDLNAALKGGALTGDLAALVGKVDTSATAWGAGVAFTAKVAKAWGTAKLKGGLTLDIHLTMASADKAKGMRDETTVQLKEAGKRVPTVGKALAGVSVGGTGSEFTLKGTIPEDQLPILAADFDHAF